MQQITSNKRQRVADIAPGKSKGEREFALCMALVLCCANLLFNLDHKHCFKTEKEWEKDCESLRQRIQEIKIDPDYYDADPYGA